MLRAWVIKRPVARPGDPVPRTGFPALARTRDTVVPPGRLVVVGDNPCRSWDSRQLGYVASDRVRGVVVRSLAGEQVTTSPAMR
jgi:signal peptidase I